MCFVLCPTERSTDGAGGAPSCSHAVHPGDGLELSAGSSRLLPTVLPQSQSKTHTGHVDFSVFVMDTAMLYARLKMSSSPIRWYLFPLSHVAPRFPNIVLYLFLFVCCVGRTRRLHRSLPYRARGLQTQSERIRSQV